MAVSVGHFTNTNKTFTIKQRLDCNSTNIIYAIQCKTCTQNGNDNCQYIGQTGRRLRDTLNEHRKTSLTEKLTNPGLQNTSVNPDTLLMTYRYCHCNLLLTIIIYAYPLVIPSFCILPHHQYSLHHHHVTFLLYIIMFAQHILIPHIHLHLPLRCSTHWPIMLQ